MSQTPIQFCPNCRAPVNTGQGFCPNCGTALPMRGVPPTVVAQSSTPGSPYPPPPMGGLPPTVAAPTPPGATPPVPSYTPAPPYASSLNNDAPPMAPYTGYGNDMVPPPPTPTPTDPYSMGGMSHQFQPPKKKTSPWLYIGIAVAVLLVIAIGGGILIAAASHSGNQTNNGGNNNNGGGLFGGSGNFSASENLNNLAITYASDNITFKSVQQAQTFSDDDLARDNILHKYYVRVNIHEQNTTSQISLVEYFDGFHLILPDGTTVSALNEQTSEGPQSQENRDNWVDFGTSGKVDLSKLVLRLGTASEQQMDVPLQSGANLAKYQPKTINPNQQFTYADMNWTLKDVNESLSFGGNQAKTGKVYIVVDLVVNNNSTNELFLNNFVTLHSGSTSTAPDFLGSSTTNFDDIQPGSTNVTGTLEFSTPASPNGQYSLVFTGSDANSQISFPSQTVNFTVN